MRPGRALPNLKSQRGQGITEAILIIVLLLGFTFAVANYFKDQEVLKQVITGPWKTLSGMLQNGVWATPATGSASHPNGHGRHISMLPEPAK